MFQRRFYLSHLSSLHPSVRDCSSFQTACHLPSSQLQSLASLCPNDFSSYELKLVTLHLLVASLGLRFKSLSPASKASHSLTNPPLFLLPQNSALMHCLISCCNSLPILLYLENSLSSSNFHFKHHPFLTFFFFFRTLF